MGHEDCRSRAVQLSFDVCVVQRLVQVQSELRCTELHALVMCGKVSQKDSSERRYGK